VYLAQPITAYQLTMLLVGGYQAIITAYLSFKIYITSRGSSELPDLQLKLGRVEEVDTPWDNHTTIRATITISNDSYGTANIRDLTFPKEKSEINRQLATEQKKPGEGRIAVGFPTLKGTPVTLNRQEEFEFTILIEGFKYYNKIVLLIDGAQLGELKYELPLFELHSSMMMSRDTEKEPIDAGQ
jgi:hypothetical protein